MQDKESNGSSKKLVEIVARALCVIHSDDPERLEPGDYLGIDGTNRKGEHCHFAWRDYVDDAVPVLTAIKEAGMVIVPREPTEAMIDAGCKADDENLAPPPGFYAADFIYRAMITAGEE